MAEDPEETARRRIDVAHATVLRAIAASLWRLGLVDVPAELDATLRGFEADVTRIRRLQAEELAEYQAADTRKLPRGVRGSGVRPAVIFGDEVTPTVSDAERHARASGTRSGTRSGDRS